MGHFLGSFVVTAVVMLFVPLGVFAGSDAGVMLGWSPAELLGEQHLSHYLQPYLVLALPTLFVIAVFCHVAALRFRTMMAVYIAAVILFSLIRLFRCILKSRRYGYGRHY